MGWDTKEPPQRVFGHTGPEWLVSVVVLGLILGMVLLGIGQTLAEGTARRVYREERLQEYCSQNRTDMARCGPVARDAPEPQRARP